MRNALLASLLSLVVATPALAAAPAQGGQADLLSPHGGLMFWTLVVFLILWFVLAKFAFKPITAAVEAREQALQEALDHARRDREEAARLLEEHRKQLEGARGEAQKLIVDARQVGERIKNEMLEEARAQQQELVERARREIDGERARAVDQLRREAVDLAIAGASRVIEQNLDADANRRLVEGFLASLGPRGAAR